MSQIYFSPRRWPSVPKIQADRWEIRLNSRFKRSRSAIEPVAKREQNYVAAVTLAAL